MQFSIVTTGLDTSSDTCIIVGIFEDGHFTPSAQKINNLSSDFLTRLIKKGGFKGKIGETLPLFELPNGLEQVLLVGCGQKQTTSPAQFKQILLATMKSLAVLTPSSVLITLQELNVHERTIPWKVRQLIESIGQGCYRFDQFKQTKETITIKQLDILVENEHEVIETQQALKEGEAIVQAVNLTKTLANLPSNICTPSFLANEAQKLSVNEPNLTVDILDEAKLREMGMGALLGVAQGSNEPPNLICLHYKGGRENQQPIAFVGKGVTFDTGGNSIKPADSMVGMKYDMCGAATVIGIIKATILLKLPLNILGIIPAVENMPGGKAYNPEDILTSLSGQTIEVISTDAEGRLILADALTYCERFNPEVVIDIATLTGAVVIALGTHASGLLSNDEALANDLMTAGNDSFDRAWRLPLWEEYQEQIKSPFADMANTGGRSAGVITAACFLSRFAKKFRWAHLDVAGTAAIMSGTSDRTATGRPVPMLMQYLLNRLRSQ